jgi:hypothetical protein
LKRSARARDWPGTIPGWRRKTWSTIISIARAAYLDGPWAAGLDDPSALERGPADTRAGWRTEVLRRLASGEGESEQAYEIDWDRIEVGEGETIAMDDPFQRSAKRAAE